jgi:hypothetical protein
MSERQDARERLKELAARMNLSIDDVLETLQAGTAAAAPRSSLDIPLSNGAIRAAICDSYTAHDSWAINLDPKVLEHSHLIMVDGKRRLRLSDEARASILHAAHDSGRLHAVLEEAAKEPAAATAALQASQATSHAIRDILGNKTLNLADAPPPVLRANVAALERLKGAPVPAATPNLQEAQRLLERAELLEPLRIMIGATGGWQSRPTGDRFAGRAAQLAELRAFVDELDSEGTFESIQRSVNRAVKRRRTDTRAEGVRLIAARGGLGKSTLIAKFVLDHALSQGRPFPFAYLDFDRASIQAREPRHLLLEVTRQVAVQFPVATEPLTLLRQQIKQSMSGFDSRLTIDVDPFAEFRRIMRDQVTHGIRALLIVLDTVEIVQCDALALRGLLQFLDRLGQGGFTELRIVAAGRAPVPQLIAESNARQAGKLIALPPLTHAEAIEMVQRLGHALLAGEWRDAWTALLAGKHSDPPDRREPLSLRVAVETVRDEEPARRDEQVRRIHELGEQGGEHFVGNLYMNRVVGHVTGGEDVRKLAWPGLVMRKITPEIIEETLAPLLGIDPRSAAALFESLASQLWIVSKNGNVLTHEPDLRARTLPLMRRRPEFATINAAAISYHGARRDVSPQNRAEWIYHRLLAGEAPQRVDADWSDAVVPFLRDAPGDFPRGGPEANYLSVRTSSHLEPNEILDRVEPRLALLHIARVGAIKGSLEDTTFDPLLLKLPLPVIPAAGLPREAEAARFTLMVKTGRWNAVTSITSASGPWQTLAGIANAYRRARTDEREALSGELGDAYWTDTSMRSTAAFVHDLAAARLVGAGEAVRIDDLIQGQLISGSKRSELTLGSATLRTAMVFGEHATATAAQLWARQATELLRATGVGAVSSQEINALLPDDNLERAARSALSASGQTWEGYLAQTQRPQDRTRVNDPSLAAAVIDAVVRCAERAAPADLLRLRRFGAARDEDWIVPIAYAAHRATNGHVPATIATLFETHLPRERGFLERAIAREPVPAGIMAVLRRADEASDIESAARMFLDDGDPTLADDLRRLLMFYRAWREGVRRLIIPSQA